MSKYWLKFTYYERKDGILEIEAENIERAKSLGIEVEEGLNKYLSDSILWSKTDEEDGISFVFAKEVSDEKQTFQNTSIKEDKAKGKKAL